MSDNEKEQLPISIVISDCINCLETSNKLLNTYQKNTTDAERKRIINYMIDTNSKCMINAMEYQASEVKELEENYIGRFVAIPIENYEQIILSADAMLDLGENIGLLSLKNSMNNIKNMLIIQE